jgi:hypothetical protein
VEPLIKFLGGFIRQLFRHFFPLVGQFFPFGGLVVHGIRAHGFLILVE